MESVYFLKEAFSFIAIKKLFQISANHSLMHGFWFLQNKVLKVRGLNEKFAFLDFIAKSFIYGFATYFYLFFCSIYQKGLLDIKVHFPIEKMVKNALHPLNISYTYEYIVHIIGNKCSDFVYHWKTFNAFFYAFFCKYNNDVLNILKD